MDRARANRDIIVPKRISRSTIASRNGSESSATRWRTVSASLWRSPWPPIGPPGAPWARHLLRLV